MSCKLSESIFISIRNRQDKPEDSVNKVYRRLDSVL